MTTQTDSVHQNGVEEEENKLERCLVDFRVAANHGKSRETDRIISSLQSLQACLCSTEDAEPLLRNDNQKERRTVANTLLRCNLALGMTGLKTSDVDQEICNVVDHCLDSFCGSLVTMQAATACLRGETTGASGKDDMEKRRIREAEIWWSARAIRRILLTSDNLNAVKKEATAGMDEAGRLSQGDEVKATGDLSHSLLEQLALESFEPFKSDSFCNDNFTSQQPDALSRVTQKLAQRRSQFQQHHKEGSVTLRHPAINHQDAVADMIMRIPSLLGKACHEMGLELFAWAVPAHYFARVLRCCAATALVHHVRTNKEKGTGFGFEAIETFFCAVLRSIVRSGHMEDAAAGWYQFWNATCGHLQKRATKDQTDKASFRERLRSLFTQAMITLQPPREQARLIRSFLLLFSSKRRQETLPTDGVGQLPPFVFDSCLGIMKSSSQSRHATVRLVVLSPPLSTKSLNRLLLRLLSTLLFYCGDNKEGTTNAEHPNDADSGADVLWEHLSSVAETWCEPIFVRQTDELLQQHVTEFVLACLSTLSNAAADVRQSVVVPLVGGVTIRLESSVKSIRRDGMKVAEAIAPMLGQTLKFDELEDEENVEINARQTSDVITSKECGSPKVGISNATDMGKSTNNNANRRRRANRKVKEIDPDEEFVSSDDDEEEGHDEEETSEDGRDADDDSVWDSDVNDDLIPYDLDDDESDLRETPKPVFLRDCLELLRTSENESDAYTRQEAAMEALSRIIQSSASDLVDVAHALTIELLHMENRYEMENFVEMRWSALTMLAVQEPKIVATGLIGEVFGSIGLGTRLDIFGILSHAAEELSGQAEIKKDRESKESKRPKDSPPRIVVTSSRLAARHSTRQTYTGHSVADVTNSDMENFEDKTRRWRSGLLRKPHTVTNRFAPLAPTVFFYPLLQAFMESRNDTAVWGGSTGEKLLTALVLTFATFVELCRNCPGNTATLMATDLFQLAWSLRHSDSGEVRAALLIALGTSLTLLPTDLTTKIMYNTDGLRDFLAELAERDPDRSCRRLAAALSTNLVEAVERFASLKETAHNYS